MATSKYNPITNNTYHYNDRGEITRIDTGKNTSAKPTVNGIYTGRETSTTGRTYDVGRVEKLNTDSGGNPIWTTSTGKQIAVRPGADVILDDNNYFLGTRKQSGAASYIGDVGSETTTNNDLYAAQLQARIEALDKQKATVLSGLDTEKTALGNQYYNKRNQIGAQSDIGALNFANFMASRSVQGNAGAMPEIYRNAGLQSQIGALDQQEALGYADIEARRSDINSAYERDIAAAKAEVEAQALQAQIEQQRIDQANALEQQKIDAENLRYNTQQNILADTTAYNRLQDTKSDYANTVSRFSNDYQAEIENITNDGNPSNDWQIAILAAARAKKMQDMEDAKVAQQAAAAKAQQQQFENDLKSKQYQLDVQKTNYDVNRPYSTASERTLTPLQQQNNANNSKIANMTNWIYNVPTSQEALGRLTQNKALILQQLQEAGYDGSTALQYYSDMYNDIVLSLPSK